MHADDAHALATQHFDTLVAALEAGHSDVLTRYLAVASRFHRYSLNNQFLIALQCPAATRVAGFHAWRRLGRWVRKGEKGIVILAPMTRRRRAVDDNPNADTQEGDATTTTRIVGFRATYVFDQAQTDGESLPTLEQQASGDPGVYLAALERIIAEAGVQLLRVANLGGALGCSRPGQITVLDSLTPADTVSVLVHELAHELIHQRGDRPTSKTVRETEAEAVAFIVSTAIGVRPSVAAADYIQLHAGNADTLRQSLERIQGTARQILRSLPFLDDGIDGNHLPTGCAADRTPTENICL